MPNEEALQAALHDYLHGPQAQGSIRRAAFVYEVPASTLRDRIHGKSPIQESHQASQLLSPTQILVVKEMIRKKDAWGFSVDHNYVREVVLSVTGEKLGKNWVTRFITRERDLESIFINQEIRNVNSPLLIHHLRVSLHRYVSIYLLLDLYYY